MFLLENNRSNRIVCLAKDIPKIYYVGTYDKDKNLIFEDFPIEKPKLIKFKNVNAMLEYIRDINVKYCQGIICFQHEFKYQIKIYNSTYMELFQARGNEPSIRFRYIQKRLDKDIVDMLYYLYPDYDIIFEDIENIIYEIGCYIYNSYVQRFIKKRFVTVAPEEFTVIKKCHSWHEDDRTNNRISMEKVLEVLNEQSPTSLNKMIRRFRTEQINKYEKNKNIRNKERSRTNDLEVPNRRLIKPVQ